MIKESEFNNIGVLIQLFKWKKVLLIVLIVSTILSLFFSSSIFITPMYKSTAYVYPVNLMKFSGESESEQMIQILESFDIRNKIFSDFPLHQHYKIKKSDKNYYTKLNVEYESNVTFSLTQYASVKIEVLDIEAQMASDMVDSIISYFNSKVSDLHKTKIKEVLEGKRLTMLQKGKEIDSLEALLNILRRDFGILDYGVQAERLTEGYIKLLVEQREQQKQLEEVKNQIKNLKEKGGEFLALNSLIWSARNVYNTTKIEFEQALQEYTKKITYVQVVTSPFPADKKAYPKLWLILFLTVFSSELLAIIILGVLENKNKYIEIFKSYNSEK